VSEFTTEVAVRYDDLDTYGHVNNVRYGTYIEEGRVGYLAEIVGDGTREFLAGGTGIVVAHLELDFERPVGPTESVTVAVEVPRLGTTSFPMAYEVRDGGTVVATGETTMVTVDPETGEPRPVPDDWRSAIERFEGH